MHAMRTVEDLLQAHGPNVSRAAHFTCTLALVWPDGSDAFFEGRVEGALVWPPRGGKGFGYDPVFVPLGQTETFGEMDPDKKHAMSHRADAFAKLVAAAF
jgi:XTP/dITP diphosphohydrolase